MSVAGRGRGYPGRHQTRELRPGGATIDVTKEPKAEPKGEERDMDKETAHMSGEDEGALADLLCVEEQFAPLLVLLEQFSPGEDGIQFNRKLRNFETSVTNLCPDEGRLTQAFSTFRAAALLSSVTARKLAAVGASFTRQQRQQLLRGALLNVVMQGTFSKLDVLERANPSYLINATNLMGDYFAEARLCNGNKVHILASPLLQYMRALLASDDIRAHRSLATQLMQNGRELLSVLAQELDDLSISIRLRLLAPPPVSIIWLLLSADLCLNKFLPLPNSLQQFYASHLELTTDENFSEVSYGSWKKSPETEVKSDTDLAEKVSQNLSQISLNADDDVKPKLRPILGAGAGLLRQEQALAQDSFETWTKKHSLSKRYDLNSWRQAEEEKKNETETVFNINVLPPSGQYPVNVPDFPPPNVRFNYQKDNYTNYLQQGDGAYIQSQFPITNANFNSQGDFAYPETQYQDKEKSFSSEKNSFNADLSNFNEQTDFDPEKAPFTPTEKEFAPQFANEKPNFSDRESSEVKPSTRRPVENWRKEKCDIKDDANKNRQKIWSRHSKDNLNDEEDDKFKTREVRMGSKINRRNSETDTSAGTVKPPPKRNVMEAPRNTKYWDHDDRCDKNYVS